jgi:hypothetical protein
VTRWNAGASPAYHPVVAGADPSLGRGLGDRNTRFPVEWRSGRDPI